MFNSFQEHYGKFCCLYSDNIFSNSLDQVQTYRHWWSMIVDFQVVLYIGAFSSGVESSVGPDQMAS